MAANKFYSVFQKATSQRVVIPLVVVEQAPNITEPGIWVCGNYVPVHTINEVHKVLFKMGNSDKVIITPSLFKPEYPTPYGKLSEDEACRIWDLYGQNYNKVRSIQPICHTSYKLPVDTFFHPDGFMLPLTMAKQFGFI